MLWRSQNLSSFPPSGVRCNWKWDRTLCSLHLRPPHPHPIAVDLTQCQANLWQRACGLDSRSFSRGCYLRYEPPACWLGLDTHCKLIPRPTDTRVHGKPDMVKLTYRIVKEFNAEAVCIISNQKLTQKIVYGMTSRGIPAFGAIWDS